MPRTKSKPIPNSYSIYDAKARLSEIIRAVKNKRRVTITERGVPVAEVVPYAEREQTLDERMAEMVAKGELIPATRRTYDVIKPIASRPGGLARFVADRE